MRIALVGSLVVLTLIGLLVAYFWYAFTYGSELSHKTGWSVLEAFEFEERATPYTAPKIRRTDDRRYAALAIEGSGEPEGGPTMPPQVLPGKAWVLLNEHAADKAVLIMPRFASYNVSCASVGRLPNAVRDVDGYVLRRLSAMCS